jgi:hypothetical protein
MVKNVGSQEGQAAVFITILLMFALIALTALAIDGAHLYVVRRDLQNMTDAACLAAAEELVLGGDDAAALAVARDYVIRNGGEFFAAWMGPEDNVGSGDGLTYGVQVAGDNVRVALQEEVLTYFTMIFDRRGAGVGARTRCNRSAGWGPLLPIAIRRYEYNPVSPTLQLDLVANKGADPRDALGYATCELGVDCHYPGTSDPITLISRYGEMDFYPLKSPYEPMTGTVDAAETGNIDCDLPPQDGTYEGMCALGVHALTNDGTENYTGWVSLDIRNIIQPWPPTYEASPWYDNSADGQAATNKALSSEWFCERGWRGRVMPMFGDQLAFLPGVSADFAPKAMLACDPPWKVGDTFIGVIYSGYVWDIPDLEMEIEPVYDEISATIAGATHTVTYTVTLEKPRESPEWPAPASFNLDAWFAAAGDITPDIDFVPSPVVTLGTADTEQTVLMTVSATDPVTPTNYVSALTVEAVETTIGLKRWASTNFGYRGDSDFDDEEDFTLHPHALEFKVVQGGMVRVELPTMAFGGFRERRVPVNIMVGGGSCSASGVFTAACENQTIDIPNDRDNVALRALAEAPLGQYTLRLTVDPDTSGVPSHYVDVVVTVQPPTGGDPTRFVIVEGFADFEISYIDNNDVIAFAIGPVVAHITSTELFGMRPSLMPW